MLTETHFRWKVLSRILHQSQWRKEVDEGIRQEGEFVESLGVEARTPDFLEYKIEEDVVRLLILICILLMYRRMKGSR